MSSEDNGGAFDLSREVTEFLHMHATSAATDKELLVTGHGSVADLLDVIRLGASGEVEEAKKLMLIRGAVDLANARKNLAESKHTGLVRTILSKLIDKGENQLKGIAKRYGMPVPDLSTLPPKEEVRVPYQPVRLKREREDEEEEDEEEQQRSTKK